MKISVIIPAYNMENRIGRTITTVLNRTVKPAKIVVVDDDLTDGGAKTVQKRG